MSFAPIGVNGRIEGLLTGTTSSIGLSYFGDNGQEMQIKTESSTLDRPIEVWIERRQSDTNHKISRDESFQFYDLSSLHLQRNYTGYLISSFNLSDGGLGNSTLYINIKPNDPNAGVGYLTLLRFLYDEPQVDDELYDLAKIMCPFG
jgi:hypothetical protein